MRVRAVSSFAHDNANVQIGDELEVSEQTALELQRVGLVEPVNEAAASRKEAPARGGEKMAPPPENKSRAEKSPDTHAHTPAHGTPSHPKKK